MEAFKKIFGLVVLSAALSRGSATGVIYTSTKVDVKWVAKASVTKLSVGSSIQKAMVMCAISDWCWVFCSQADDGYVILSLIAAAWSEEPPGSSSMTCFTRRPRTNIFRAQSVSVVSASESGVQPAFAVRLPHWFTDGVYDLAISSCYYAKATTRPYVVLDLGAELNISKVSILAQPIRYDEVVKHFSNLEVRVGMTPTYPDFSSYALIGKLVGAAPYEGYDFVSSVSPPITGRYLSVQRFDSGDNPMQICHIEVYA